MKFPPVRLAAALLLFAAATLRAQDPSRSYFTIRTTHFHVHFTQPLEPVARRVAADAERAYAQLSGDLHPPRGPIDILVTDDVDYSNGSAITYPTNRIVIYATPPINDSGLRFTNDWAQMVVTHELTHIFHLDRSRGFWRLAQGVFGRSPFLFPNFYQPSWLIEGLAVYEESRQAGEGRIEGPEHNLLARAAAADHAFPSISKASLALPTFPGGEAAYAYGSLFMSYLARTRGDSSIRRYVESSSGQIIPYLIDIPARQAFGSTLEHAWSDWQKTVEAGVSATPAATPTGGGLRWKDLTPDRLSASFPRWVDDSTLSYGGSTGKDVFAARLLGLNGHETRIGNRTGESPNVRLADGSWLYSQFEFITPYEYRSDLYIQRGTRQHRLTKNQRLFAPDARADGEIVATQLVAGASRLVRVSRDGGTIAPLTRASYDTLWSEPRWSHRGDQVVASRWLRGGISQIVILDTTGVVRSLVASGKLVLAAPSFLPDDSGILYAASTDSGSTAFITSLARGSSQIALAGSTPFFEPALRFDLTAALALRGNGFRVGVEHCCNSLPVPTPRDTIPDRRLPLLAVDTSVAREYSALRQMIPRYWVPLADAGMDNGATRFGGYTEAYDILQRHYLYAQALFPNDNSGIVAAMMYRYAGLGVPVISVNASQDWTKYGTVVTNSTPSTVIGSVRRRIRDGEVLGTFVRQRARSVLSASFGAGVERREYVSVPGSLLGGLDTTGRFDAATFPRLMLSSGYARYLSPAFAISPEDGFTAASTLRERLSSGFNGTSGPSTSVVGALTGFKALDLPGYAHHVIAARAAGGWADTKASGYFEVGGISGGTFQVLPGYTVGEGRENFQVRGFPSGVLTGIRALGLNGEYRAPLSLTHRGWGSLPVFIQRTALTAFGDYGTAWCPSAASNREVCTTSARTERAAIASIGGELSIDAGLLSWDSPYRFRFGFAHPVHNGSAFKVAQSTFYFSSGFSF